MNNDAIKERIRQIHLGDEKQLEIISTPKKRLLIEAPAGYGKTKTMVSKIAYMLSSNQIPYPKRLLALTFSVNAAYKIKKDVSQNIPQILEGEKVGFAVSEKILVSNYHGFSRRILKRYGYKMHTNLIEIDKLQSIDDSSATNLMQTIAGLSYESAAALANFNAATKNVNRAYIQANIDRYNDIVINELLPLHIIPYNAILALASKLLKDSPVIRTFYQSLYTTILVDEFQDTNILSYILLFYLIGEKSNVILMGDSLQRIYGFIGAIPDLLNKAATQFGLEKIVLNKNYRFKDNKEMLLLDYNVRRNAENPNAPVIVNDAQVQFTHLDNQIDEARHLIQKCNDIIEEFPESKVAILVRQRGPNVDAIISEFNHTATPFFYSLFSDDDATYIKFSRECLFEFIELLRVKDQVTKKMTAKLISKIKIKFPPGDVITDAVTKLLEVFLSRIFTEFSFLSNEEKKELIIDTFENQGLKQYMEFIDAKVIIATVHGSKGLEWEYVIIPDMESNSFPSYYGLCRDCRCGADCNLVLIPAIEDKYLEELSVFYVALTRARKQVYFTASKTQVDYRGNVVNRNISCLMKMKGIELA